MSAASAGLSEAGTLTQPVQPLLLDQLGYLWLEPFMQLPNACVTTVMWRHMYNKHLKHLGHFANVLLQRIFIVT